MTSGPVDATKPKRAASVFDVARAAGVSHQTVSRVLNDHSSVRPATRQKVLTAMGELNYRPNLAARALSSKRSRTLGVLSTASGEYGPSSSIIAITEAARTRGYTTIVEQTDGLDVASIEEALGNLASLNVEGIVAVAPQTPLLEVLGNMTSGIPFVTLQTWTSDGGVDLAEDQLEGARVATAHLLDLGHVDVVHLAGPGDWIDATSRLRGFRLEMESRGLTPRHVDARDWSPEAGYAAAATIFESNATAVFCANDQTALGVLHAAHDAGVSVPEQLSVVGFDDIPEAAHFWPPLTTVRQHFAATGAQCVARLLDGAQGAADVLPELIVRASTRRV
ncbi:DNA-binding LacI/PurR family transcriptional regulator [Pseudoclavibacter sp. JAI123]|uniref:LacI family DNA-binding transcriptional regulator n=1 Tax=Pseudoclavibacter sp. JAI123 TaxID=2723065 RepID=UPI0015CE81C3|nr:LacI family DNA-binding transcriptional regulator [Pseudoclavibacter sp. JAI123]NYF14765.1 DNA-binding LacI/PurR family transcriptional regulator [Pseudoclavibacter sp. JAI123]